jgi:hypothetical protein
MAGEIAQAASGPISQVISMIGQKKRNERAYQQQRALNQQGHDLSMDMWNKTNVGAQKEHYEKAGMNPALMYGQTGATGTTSMASGGSAPAQPPMDMSSIMMGAQLALLKAQTKKTENEANNIGTDGVDNINTQADTADKKAAAILKQQQAKNVELKNVTQIAEAQSIIARNNAATEKSLADANLTNENKMNIIQGQINANLESVNRSMRIKTGIDLDKAQLNILEKELCQMDRELEIKGEKNNIEAYKSTTGRMEYILKEVLGFKNFDQRKLEMWVTEGNKAIGNLLKLVPSTGNITTVLRGKAE